MAQRLAPVLTTPLTADRAPDLSLELKPALQSRSEIARLALQAVHAQLGLGSGVAAGVGLNVASELEASVDWKVALGMAPEPPDSMAPPTTQRSLKNRAVDYLSRRDYSRSELAAKLAQPSYAARQYAAMRQAAMPEPPSARQIDAVLDDLAQQGFLNDVRFAQGLAQRSASKHGTARVMAALSKHGLDSATTSGLAAQLKTSELPRCFEVWSKRFASVDLADLRDTDYCAAQAALAKQSRFLMQRGFSPDAVRKVLGGWKPDHD